jgi:hypothetical protein
MKVLVPNREEPRGVFVDHCFKPSELLRTESSTSFELDGIEPKLGPLTIVLDMDVRWFTSVA